MINKQNLWFVTLFSLILILGIYYVSLDDEVKTVLKEDNNTSNKEVIEITESDVLVALEVEKEEQKQTLLEEYQDILLNNNSTVTEKNDAYDNIQKLKESTIDEEKIKERIKKQFNLNAFVKIDGDKISVVIEGNKHDTTLANNIIRNVQELFEDQKYITVKFNK